MLNDAMPKSTATNAYELLDEIKALALEEPKRIDMNNWRLSDGDVFPALTRRGYPACGTVGCIGGWVEVLSGCRPNGAEGILGLSSAQSNELFWDPALITHGKSHGQTAKHARLTVQHIARFQAKYESQLKAKAL